MLSSHARTAMRAMLELSLRHGEGRVRIQDIAQRQNIPLKYLQQIMLSLKNAGFVESRKGPGGGYVLASAPEDISLASVWRAMDGPIAPTSCVSVYSYHECGCPEPDSCALRRAFFEVREAMIAVLEKTTFDVLRSQHGVPIENLREALLT